VELAPKLSRGVQGFSNVRSQHLTSTMLPHVMHMTLSADVRSGLLQATLTGEFTLEAAQTTFLEVLAAAAQHGTQKILLDGRALTGAPEPMERYYYGEFIARSVLRYRMSGSLRTSQFAYVLREPVLDPQRFGETVAVNRGMWVRIFDDLDGALAWLGIGGDQQSS
jgi:hypothetical protein